MNRYFMKRNKYEEITYTIKLNIIMGAVLIAVFYVTKNTELISRRDDNTEEKSNINFRKTDARKQAAI